MALARLKGKVGYEPIGFELLPPAFTLSQLQQLYEAVVGTKLDKRNFRKKVLGFGLLVPLKEKQLLGRASPRAVVSIRQREIREIKETGIPF